MCIKNGLLQSDIKEFDHSDMPGLASQKHSVTIRWVIGETTRVTIANVAQIEFQGVMSLGRLEQA